jgi:hypothetical protein
VTRCPRCGHHFVPARDLRSESSFYLFHVYRDAFAKHQGWSNVYAKNWLCVHYGVAIDCGRDTEDWAIGFAAAMPRPPKWAGVFCVVDGEWYYRKSTTIYTKAEMTDLIARTAAQMAEAGIEVPVT